MAYAAHQANEFTTAKVCKPTNLLGTLKFQGCFGSPLGWVALLYISHRCFHEGMALIVKVKPVQDLYKPWLYS
jgi:hypothetical protein